MRVTLDVVAERAGVSVMTASRALAGTGSVRPATRQRVLEAARDVGYRPNRAAAHLRGGLTGRLGIITPDLMNPFFTEVLKGAQARARDRGLSVFVADSDDDPGTERELISAFAQRADGVLLTTSRLRDDELRELRSAIPLVLLHRTCAGIPSVITDVADGLQQALDNLVALGHVDIGYVDGPATSWSAGLRRRSVEGLRLPEGVRVRVITRVAAQLEGGVAAGDIVIASGVTAVLAFNDIVALGILHRLHERGLLVPDDVSLVGFDGISASVMARPAITTVAQPLASSGRVGVDLLTQLIADSEETATEVLLPPLLTVRETTGPLPSRQRKQVVL